MTCVRRAAAAALVLMAVPVAGCSGGSAAPAVRTVESSSVSRSGPVTTSAPASSTIPAPSPTVTRASASTPLCSIFTAARASQVQPGSRIGGPTAALSAVPGQSGCGWVVRADLSDGQISLTQFTPEAVAAKAGSARSVLDTFVQQIITYQNRSATAGAGDITALQHPAGLGTYSDFYVHAYVPDSSGGPVIGWTSGGYVYVLDAEVPAATQANVLALAEELAPILPG